MWYTYLQSAYWRANSDLEKSPDCVEARIWEAVRSVKVHLKHGEKKAGKVADEQPKTLDMLDNSEAQTTMDTSSSVV